MSFSPVKVTQMRELMNRELFEYFESFSDMQDAMDRVANNKLKTSLSIIPPELFDCTVGLGKSSGIAPIVKEALSRGLKICIVVPTHKLADEYCAKIPTAYHYFGRQSVEEATNDAQRQKFICHQKDSVNQAAEKNHLPSQSICRACPHAHTHILENVSNDEERVDKARQFFKIRNLKPEKYEQCRFLYDGLPEALASNVVVITPGSFSDAMGFYQVKSGRQVINQMQRLVIVDEKINLTKEINICAAGIQGWLNALDRLKQRLEESKTQPELLALLPEVESAFKMLGAKIMLGEDIDKQAILDIYNRSKEAGWIKSNTAKWEHIEFIEQQEFLIPLRALHTLAHNLEKGTVRKSKNKTHVYEVSQLVEWAIERGSTVFLDATSPLAMKALIRAINGTYFDAHVPQNLCVTRFEGHLYSRGNPRLKNYPATAQKRISELELIASQLSKPAAIITHKAWLKNSVECYMSDDAAEIAANIFFEKTGVKLGWFGAHDRGHNEWQGYNLAIVGVTLLPPAAIMAGYSGDRTALMTVGVNWPEWDEELTDPIWSDCIPPLPKQSYVRAWLLDRYAADIAQAIGRARAVNAPTPISIQLFGGLQTAEFDAALNAHGVTINVTTKDTVHRSVKQYRARGTDIGTIDEAIRQLLLRDEKTSRRSVRAQLETMGMSASDRAINGRLAELRKAGELAPAPQPGRPPKLVHDANNNLYGIAHQLFNAP